MTRCPEEGCAPLRRMRTELIGRTVTNAQKRARCCCVHAHGGTGRHLLGVTGLQLIGDKENAMSEAVAHRSVDFRPSSIDESARTATFVAATEAPVRVASGPPEVLRMSGAAIERYKLNPVVLDSHDRTAVGAIVGRADVTVSGRQLLATVAFAKTGRGDDAWALVRGGFLRATSIGYRAIQGFRLPAGETDGDGDGVVTGPATIVTNWELLEVSVVPVPADANALVRSRGMTAAERGELPVSDDDLIRALTGSEQEAQEAPFLAAPLPVADDVLVRSLEQLGEETR